MTLSETEFVSRTRNAATRCVLRAYNAAKCDCGRGSARTPLGELTALPRSRSCFKAAGGEGKVEEGKEKGGEGQGGS